MEMVSKFIIPAIVFVLTIASAVWLSSSGKPLNTAIFNAHKLIALGLVVIIAIQVYGLLKNVAVQPFIIGLLVLAGLCVVALFATGALMSIGKVTYEPMRIVHIIAAVLLPIALVASIYLFSWRLK